MGYSCINLTAFDNLITLKEKVAYIFNKNGTRKTNKIRRKGKIFNNN